jgi:hypothetical protein
MLMLDEKKLIILLGPCKHEVTGLNPESEVDIRLYVSSPSNGEHQLMAVTKNQSEFLNFGSHADNEEFLLIGDNNAKPLFLLVALIKHDELDIKAVNGTLTENDFILLRCKFNDPECSFFTMLKDTPHGECSIQGKGRDPSFYVTEPSAMPHRISNLHDFMFKIDG